MYICIYIYILIYMHSCKCMGIRVCVHMHVWAFSVYLYLFVCSVACYSVSDPFRRPGPDPDLCSSWTRYIGELKTDPWDDPYISTVSCSEDQTVIRFRNRVISCERSFLCIPYVSLSVCIYILHLLFHAASCYMLSV